MRPQLIAGNWKMYKKASETQAFLSVLKERASEWQKKELLLFCQAPLLGLFQKESSRLAYGPQNIYWEEKGAFTGELSPALAKEFGSTYALAGHSERRHIFGENNESCVKRALAAHAFGMKAVFCVGETLVERDSGNTLKVIREQCAPLFDIAPDAPIGFTFAYEPVWAIGTGRTATTEQAQEAHVFLRKEISASWGAEFAAGCRILYGGSVKPQNAKKLMQQPDVDGVLVGGASIEIDSFLEIAAAANRC